MITAPPTIDIGISEADRQAIAEGLVHVYSGNVSQYDHMNTHTVPWLRPSLSASP